MILLLTPSKRERRLIFALINLCLFFLFYHVISTNYYRINENNQDITLIEQQIENRRFDIFNEPQVLLQIEEYQMQNEQIRYYLLPVINNQFLHMYVENFLSQNNLSTINLSIMVVENLEDVGTIVDLTANVRGEAIDFYNFLAEIENQDKLINVEMLEISRDSLGNYNFSFTLRFFMSQYSNDSNFNFDFQSEQDADHYAEQYIE